MSAGQSAEKRNHFDQHNVVDLPIANQAQVDKGLATLKAKFTMAGHQVHDGDTGDFLVTRWGMSRWCEHVEALRTFARVLGVRQ